MVVERLRKLRREMAERNIDFYYIPTGDYHNTENVADYFKTRQYMSGFTGSEGDLLVSKDKAWLWIDGRYFLQSKRELEDLPIERMELGEEGVLSLVEVLKENMDKESVLAMDGRVVSYSFIENLIEEIGLDEDKLVSDEDLVGVIWKNRPQISDKKAFFIDEEAYEKRCTKIKRIQSYMKEKDLQAILFTQLDDICWTLNMRGRDVKFFPVVFSYLLFLNNRIVLFVDEKKIDEENRKKLTEEGIEILPYENIFSFLETMEEKKVSIDKDVASYEIIKRLGQREFVFEKSPVILWKAIKNEREIEDSIKAHIKDGVAMVKLLYWLDSVKDKKQLTELMVAQKIDALRSEQEGFIEPSFQTISAYRENGAIVHYTPKEDSKTLDNKGFLLLDSGGQYLEGTTDITRTIALGELTDEEKAHFTAVLRGMIRLSDSKFLEGCTGMNLDILARGILWNMNLDYKHGTGHGVGHILGVHETPIGLRWKRVENIDDMAKLEKGMMLSNEPGVYIENSHGIRIENQLLIDRDEKNIYGQFLKFHTLSLVPIDIRGILLKNMEKSEVIWLNIYHERVYSTLKEFLTIEERLWLKEATKKLNYLS